MRRALANAIGALFLIGAVVWAFVGQAPTAAIELVGKVGDTNDEAVALVLCAAAPFVFGLIVLGLVNTSWASGSISPPVPPERPALDKERVDTLKSAIDTLGGSLETVRESLGVAHSRLDRIEDRLATSQGRETERGSK